MNGRLAYHVVVNAMEARAGWTDQSRFASAVASVICGHHPHRRYREAGAARKREGAGEGVVEKLVGHWMPIDLNPAVQIVSNLRSEAAVIAAYNAYNAAVDLGVRTSIARPDGQGGLVVRRDSFVDEPDPETCRLGSVMVVEAVMARVRRARESEAPPKRQSLSGVAEMLGLGSTAAGEACAAIESLGHVPVAELARALGCGQRTLERRLREQGVTADALRQAARLVAATGRLAEGVSLTEIAVDEGFCDLPHMAKAFRISCGMAPSLCRRMVVGEVCAASA